MTNVQKDSSAIVKATSGGSSKKGARGVHRKENIIDKIEGKIEEGKERRRIKREAKENAKEADPNEDQERLSPEDRQ